MGMMDREHWNDLDQAHGSAFDARWVDAATAQHTAEIALCRTELRLGANPQARALAQRMLTDRQADLSQLHTWHDSWARDHGWSHDYGMYGGMMGGTSCAVPALPGQRVTVVLSDMGGGMMGGGMVLYAVPQTVSSGMVSLVAVNHGTRTHELVVLPLASGAALGARPVGADNTVDESGSLGEASADCRAGGGDGITAGGAGWVSLPLQPGRYELICNLPGHYAAGMYTELDVT